MMEPSRSRAMITEAVVWTLAPLAIIVVSLRFYTRAFIVRRIGWDDWIMLLATVLMLKNSCFVQVSIHFGLGRHQDTLRVENAIEAIKWDYLAQPSAIMAPTFGRISFAMLLLTLTGILKSRRFLLYGIIVSQLFVNSLCFILILAQCQPVQLLWDKRLEGTCWDLKAQEYFGYFQGAVSSATDLILAILPATIVWNLKMRLAQKVTVAVLMGLGVFAMIGSIFKTVYLSSLGSGDDYTYNTAILIIWWTVENYLVIIAASIATLKPLISRRGRAVDISGNSFGITSFGSRQTKGFTLDYIADDVSLTLTGVGEPDVEARPSMTNLAEHSEGNGMMNIRKAVGVSVNIGTHN
ncbi:integral membrane protein [Hypomontagnella monticulosa]|nr:integral membrane protein [Hypomontagnella monticulosa]